VVGDPARFLETFLAESVEQEWREEERQRISCEVQEQGRGRSLRMESALERGWPIGRELRTVQELQTGPA
jgi:hypothetical protein